MSAPFDISFKVLLIGDSSVGKSALMMRAIGKPFSNISTIGVDCRSLTLNVGELVVRLNLFDTAGQERFRALTSSYYKGAHGVFLVFDLTEESSFQSISSWQREIEMHTDKSLNMVLIGNKCDLPRVVSFRDAKDFANLQSMTFLETSAKTGVGVDRAFLTMAEEMVSSHDHANAPKKQHASKNRGSISKSANSQESVRLSKDPHLISTKTSCC